MANEKKPKSAQVGAEEVSVTLFSPQDGDTVPLVFASYGDVSPEDASMSAWVTDADGTLTYGLPTSVLDYPWAFNFTVLRTGPHTLTVEAVDPLGTEQVYRQITVVPPPVQPGQP